jgi:hypothetical protein
VFAPLYDLFFLLSLKDPMLSPKIARRMIGELLMTIPRLHASILNLGSRLFPLSDHRSSGAAACCPAPAASDTRRLLFHLGSLPEYLNDEICLSK